MTTISPVVLAFTDRAEHTEVSKDFFSAWTELGVKPHIYLDDHTDNVDLADLMMAHAIASRTPHPLLEGMWLEGMRDYPLGRILLDCFAWDKATFLRKRPLFERIYNVHNKTQGKVAQAPNSND